MPEIAIGLSGNCGASVQSPLGTSETSTWDDNIGCIKTFRKTDNGELAQNSATTVLRSKPLLIETNEAALA